MARRQKTRFEKFFSLNQHRKRLGAGKHVSADVDFAKLKANLIDLGTPVQTYGSEKSLDLHLENLKKEFSGQSELLFYHAQLIVLLRRDVKIEDTFAKFQALWAQEGPFLKENLNLRWLVSACESFADHSKDGRVQAIAMQGSMMANIIKLYETERLLSDGAPSQVDETRTAELHDNLKPLFEGMSCFAVGTDDTLRNFRWRMDKMFAEPLVGPLVCEIFDRMQINDTVFKRFKALHKRERNSWW